MDQATLEEYRNISDFIFTDKTITYHDKTIQLKNVTRIEKYSLKETQYAQYRITDKLYGNSIWGILGGVVLSVIFPPAGLIILLIAGIIRYMGWDERKNKKDRDIFHFGLVIETSSGRIENLLTDDSKFIDDLFDNITIAMNSDKPKIIQANFDNKQINIENISGDKVSGDKFEDIYNSEVTNRSTVNN